MLNKHIYVYIYMYVCFRPTNNDQYAPKEFSIIGSEATTRKTPPSFLHSLPALPALCYSLESLGQETSYGFPMVLTLFLQEMRPLQQHDLGQGSRSLERNLQTKLRASGLRLR